MKDWETNLCGTEQALREALELLGIKVEGSPVEAWRIHKEYLEEEYRNHQFAINEGLMYDLEGRN